jgi:hypothetical protein
MATNRPVSNDYNQVKQNWKNWTDDEWTSFVRDNVRFTQSQIVVQETSVQLSNDASNIQTTNTERSGQLNEFGNVSKLYVAMSVNGELKAMTSIVNAKVFDAGSLIRLTKRGFSSIVKEFGLQFDNAALTPERFKTIIDQYYDGTVFASDDSNFGFLTYPIEVDDLLGDLGLDSSDTFTQPIELAELNRINNRYGFGNEREAVLLKEVLEKHDFPELSDKLLKSEFSSRDYLGQRPYASIMEQLDMFVENDGFGPIFINQRYQLETDSEPDEDGLISIRITDKYTLTPVEEGKVYTWDGSQGDLQSVIDSDELYKRTMSRLGNLEITPTTIAEWQQSAEMPDTAKQFIEGMRTFTSYSTNDIDYAILPEVINGIPTAIFIQQMEEFDYGITDELAGETFGAKTVDGTFAVYHVVGGTDAYFVEEFQNEIVAKMDIDISHGEYPEFDDVELLASIDRTVSELADSEAVSRVEVNQQTLQEFAEFASEVISYSNNFTETFEPARNPQNSLGRIDDPRI